MFEREGFHHISSLTSELVSQFLALSFYEGSILWMLSGAADFFLKWSRVLMATILFPARFVRLDPLIQPDLSHTIKRVCADSSVC